MDRKEFVLDLIINKLTLKDASIEDTKELIAKFTFGDLQLDITTGRVNVADFGEGRSVEFSSTLEELKTKLEITPLELTLLKPEEEKAEPANQAEQADTGVENGAETKAENEPEAGAETEPEAGAEAEPEAEDRAEDRAEGGAESGTDDGSENDEAESNEIDDAEAPEENTENEPSRGKSDEGKNAQTTYKDIGKVSVKWPPFLIQKLTDHCTAVVPYIQVCDIVHEDEVAGTLTMAIMLHCKCEQRPLPADPNQPYINEHGILTAFQEARKEIEKNDVFFVIGRNPEPCPDPDSLVEEPSPCLTKRQRYPIRLDTSKYKLLRGSLVKDCTPILEDVCGEQECSVPWYKPEEESKQKKSSEMRRNALTCEEVFGFPKLNEDMRRSSFKGAQTYERSGRRMSERKTSFSRSSAARRSSLPKAISKDKLNGFGTTGNLQQIIFDKLEMYRRELEEPSEEPDRRNILPTRHCSKCCENLTLYPRRASCPKCGYKPPTKFIHDINETADDIVCQWDSDEKTFLQEKGFSKYDHCTCHERGDRKFKRKCLYCRIRELQNEVTDQVPPEDELFGPGRERILSDSDISASNDEQQICDKILSMYGNDSKECIIGLRQDEESPSKLLVKSKQNLSKKCRSPYEQYIPPCKPEKPKKARNKNAGLSQQNSREEKIAKVMETMCEPVSEPPPKPKPQTIKQLMKDMRRKYGRRYCYPKRKNIEKNHDECIPDNYRVPPNMGWMWSNYEQAMKKGWRPGKIGRSIRELMHYFLRDFPADSLPTTQELANAIRPPPEVEPPEQLVQRPTLHIQKRDGQFLITMHPLKAEKELWYSADPCAKTEPIQFKITKNPLDMKRRQVKRYLKDIGFSKCICKRPAVQCTCRSYMEKERLDNSLKHICDLIQATSLRDAVCLSDTTDSESHLNIEFTPPAGVIKPHLMTKPDIAETCTQYDENDYIPAFEKRTENICERGMKSKKRRPCPGPIQNIPCQAAPVIRKVRRIKLKPKDGTKKDKKNANKNKAAPKQSGQPAAKLPKKQVDNKVK